MRGILLFAHGARDPQWAQPFEAMQRQLRRLKPEAQVSLAFLEFLPPNLTEAGEGLVREGCTHIDVLPLFLGAGGHVRKDVPVLVQGLIERHPDVQWTLLPAIGEMPSLSTALAIIAAEAVDASALAPRP